MSNISFFHKMIQAIDFINKRARKKVNKTRKEHGFTLMELGIVIAIISILAAVIVPEIIESMHNRMAEKAASDISVLHDAARAYYVGVDAFGAPHSRWPGINPGTCTMNNLTARSELLLGGFITGGGAPDNPEHTVGYFLTNPWGEEYEMVLMGSNIANTHGCMFGIVTIIPRRLENYFISLLPQAYCRAEACESVSTLGPAGAGFSRCCSFISKPGIEAMRNPCEDSWAGKVIIYDDINNIICCGFGTVGETCL